MKGLPLLWVAAALAPIAPLHAERPRTYLASIAGIPLGPNEYVDRFQIDTWGVTFVAVCHIPPGWEVRAGKAATPDGIIAGEASHGVTFLDRRRLPELQGLALIRLDGPVRRQEGRVPGAIVPATFAGHAEVGSHNEGPRRRVPLGAANVRLTPATRCPEPAD